jgi:hypothetical protein
MIHLMDKEYNNEHQYNAKGGGFYPFRGFSFW